MDAKKRLIPSNLKENNFDLLRLLLAVAVLFSHSYVIMYGTMESEPAAVFSGGQTELGIMSVYGFFIISGFLIVRSFEGSKSLVEYLKKRILRIVPGFVVAFCFSLGIVAVLATRDPQHPFGNFETYSSLILWRQQIFNLATLQPPQMTGLFSSLPLPNDLNASMWTIQHEFMCYLIVPLIALAALFRRKWIMLAAFAIALVASAMIDLPFLSDWKDANTRLINWPGYFPRFSVYFFAGALCYLYRLHIPRNRWLALTAGVITILCARIGGFAFAFPFTGTYLLFYLAYHPRILFSTFAKHGDLSYGTYLYAWPVQQLVLLYTISWVNLPVFFIISLLITLSIAYLSWTLVEKRFLRLKEKKSADQPVVAINV